MPELESPESGSDNGRGLDALERAREAFSRRAWAAAYSAFESAERTAPLDACDLEQFATCAYLLGRDAEYLKTLERAYHAHLSAKERARASRAAFWVSLHLLLRAEPAQARGWLGRAQRCLDTEAPDCLEHGYLLLPRIEEQLGAMHYEAAGAAAARAIEIAQRFGDQDLIAFARHLQGRLQVLQGEVLRGLAVLDEVMVSATAGELSPITTGLLYCSVIESCHSVYALDRAHEWTRALAAWCDEQPDVVAFSRERSLPSAVRGPVDL